MALSLDRRTFLRGAGGVALALPWLEVMAPRRALAQAMPPPKRYVVAFGGSSLAGCANTIGQVLPVTVGMGYGLTRALRPLGGRDSDPMKYPYASVKSEVSVVSNLTIPWQTAGAVPAGGRVAGFHASTLCPLFSGTRAMNQGAEPSAPTSDQLVADVVSPGTRLRSLQYRVQPDAYRGGGGIRSRMAFAASSTGAIVPLDPITSPRLAWQQLFGAFTPVDANLEQRRALARERSILDRVKRSAERLEARLGTPDRQRLERHFEEVRELERRIAEVPEPPTTSCVVPPQPGEDPPISIHIQEGTGYAIGWSDEELRARLFADMIHMAFVCDLSRVVSWMFTFGQSFMNAQAILNGNRIAELHELGHCAGVDGDLADTIAWHIRHWAYLIDKLRGTPEGEGTLLDSTGLALLFEGGYGFDPEFGSGPGSHSSEGMMALAAGRAGGLRQGRHIDGAGRHPGSVLVSLMHGLGVTRALGDVSTGIAELHG